MSAEAASDLRFEIGHVLFIDIVGYSKSLIDEQREQIQELREVVRGTEQFRLAEADGKLMRLPTGDGGALVFRNTQEAPVLCALEIGKALKNHPGLQVRMGIHSGPVNEVADLNEQVNMAGAGVNIAQRVMDCGDAGHILLSRHTAEDLGQYRQWQAQLHDLGECDIKHGGRLHVVNLCNEELGNPQVPTKFRQAAQKRRWALIAALILLAGAVGGGYYFFSQRPAFKPPDKSIAVLPFENLSRDPDNAYFADGIQEEILTRLAKIADLKVISRTSTQQFQSKPANLSQIAKKLGVANILEGSVQRSADQIRVNVQLVKAATDVHLWADTFDRKLTDIFAVESDIATAIADTLQAKLNGAEKQLISSQPTSDLTAYELYLKGRSLWRKRSGDNIPKAIAFYEQAIARDPNYALAYAGMAEAYVVLPWFTGTVPRDATPKAKAAALKAVQLDDNLAEAHTALADVLFWDFDMAGSISEFQRAIAQNPNYATAHHWYGSDPLRAIGRFDEAIAEGKRAIELDPLSPVINLDLGRTLMMARRYDEAIAQLRKTLEIDPTFFYARFNLGIALQLNGDVPAAIAEYTKAQQLADNNLGARVLLAITKTQSGDKDAAARMLAEPEELSRHRSVHPYWRALLYLSLENRDEAIRWLEQAIAEHDGLNIAWIKVDPFLDPLRGDPRFETLVQKVLAPKNSRTDAAER